MLERSTRAGLFQDSLSTLGQLAMREAGADGYALFTKSPETGKLAPQFACGVPIPQHALSDGVGPALVSYPLQPDGLLVFIFKSRDSSQSKHRQLDKMAATIEAVWAAAYSSKRYFEYVNRLAELEAHLAGSKIADRARGLQSKGSSADVVDVIARHVETVLRPSPVSQLLEQFVHDRDGMNLMLDDKIGNSLGRTIRLY